jgi:hypothetical protein
MLRTSPHRHLTVRVATPDDALDLARLATLDGAAPLRGCVLVADIDGVSVAAISVRGGDVVADPFERTADIVGVLRLRVRQIHAHRARRRLSLRARPARAPRPALAS